VSAGGGESRSREAHQPDGTPRSASRSIPTHWCVILGFISGLGTDPGVLSTWTYISTILFFLVPNHLVSIDRLPVTPFGFESFTVLLIIVVRAVPITLLTCREVQRPHRDFSTDLADCAESSSDSTRAPDAER